jgi:purine-binding chemotaxis protein CheW
MHAKSGLKRNLMMTIVSQYKNVFPQTEVAVFSLRDKMFGVEIACVREIAGMTDITVVHESSGLIKGVVNLRGKIITVVDFWGVTNASPQEPASLSARIIFIELNKNIFGLIVDQVFDVVNVRLEQVDSSLDQFIKAIGKVEKRSIPILDMERFSLKLMKG